MNRDRADWGITNEYKWTSWAAPNELDINMSTVANRGFRYGSGVSNPNYPGREGYTINYNPYLLLGYDEEEEDSGSGGGSCGIGFGVISLLAAAAIAIRKKG
jgi:hypothetical protein